MRKAAERLRLRLLEIQKGAVSAVARRGGLKYASLKEMRSGHRSANVTVNTLQDLAVGLGESIGQVLGERDTEFGRLALASGLSLDDLALLLAVDASTIWAWKFGTETASEPHADTLREYIRRHTVTTDRSRPDVPPSSERRRRRP